MPSIQKSAILTLNHNYFDGIEHVSNGRLKFFLVRGQEVLVFAAAGQQVPHAAPHKVQPLGLEADHLEAGGLRVQNGSVQLIKVTRADRQEPERKGSKIFGPLNFTLHISKVNAGYVSFLSSKTRVMNCKFVPSWSVRKAVLKPSN